MEKKTFPSAEEETSPFTDASTTHFFWRTTIRQGRILRKDLCETQNIQVEVVVVRNRGGSNLLSRTVAQQMGLVKRVEEINENVFGASGFLKTDPVMIKLKEVSHPTASQQHVEFHFHFKRR